VHPSILKETSLPLWLQLANSPIREVEEDLLNASFGLQLAFTHVLRSSRSVSLPFMHSMSVSSHGDDVTIVNVHFSYMKIMISLGFW
jgi:hypothetical protein